MATPKTYLDPQPTTGYARNPELDAQVRAAPSDPAAYLVYADWLTQHGDPRGELIVVQHKLQSADEAARPALLTREAELLADNGHFLGGIVTGKAPAHFTDVSDGVVSVTWSRGFFATARIFNVIDWMDSKFPAREVCERLFALPAATCLNELRVGVLRWEYQAEDVKALIEEAAKAPFAAGLSVLRLGDVEGIDIDCAHHPLGDLSDISRTFPKLRELTIWGCEISLGEALVLPELRTLKVETCGLGSKSLAAIVNGKLPALEHLDVWFGAEDGGSDSSLEDITALLHSANFPKLQHLGLMNCELTDEICGVLGNAKILPQLSSLDLSKGTLSDEGARTLLQNRAALAHLKRLDVSESFLAPAMITELEGLGPELVAGDQKDIEDDYRYVSLAE